jgi:RES domain-containing protein
MASSRSVITAWRIVKAAHAGEAFSGFGAYRWGGRWNSRGRRAVYAAQSVAPAALELLVHLQNTDPLDDYVLIPCGLPVRLITTIDEETLPANWRSSPIPAAVRSIGDHWLDRRTSLVLSVPSAVVSRERNYVLNLKHARFETIGSRSGLGRKEGLQPASAPGAANGPPAAGTQQVGGVRAWNYERRKHSQLPPHARGETIHHRFAAHVS